jgi:hypothetical protein
MKRDVPSLDPDLQSLLAEVRLPRPLRDTVRARALARARATVTAAGSPPARATRSQPRSLWMALILVGALGAGVALGAAGGALAAVVVDAVRIGR